MKNVELYESFISNELQSYVDIDVLTKNVNIPNIDKYKSKLSIDKYILDLVDKYKNSKDSREKENTIKDFKNYLERKYNIK